MSSAGGDRWYWRCLSSQKSESPRTQAETGGGGVVVEGAEGGFTKSGRSIEGDAKQTSIKGGPGLDYRRGCSWRRCGPAHLFPLRHTHTHRLRGG